MWKFRLNNTEVEEPIGWDSVEFTLRRSKEFYGTEFVFSSSLTFSGSGYLLLATEYEKHGIDALVVLTILDGCGFSESYAINFNIYSRNRGERTVEVGLKQSGFSETFKSRVDSQVNLESLFSLDGDTLTRVAPKTIDLHAKRLLLIARYGINEYLSSFSLRRDTPGANVRNEENVYYLTPPYQAKITDLDGFREPNYYDPAIDNPVFFAGSLPQGVVYRKIDIKLRARIRFESESVLFRIGNDRFEYRGDLFFSIRVAGLDGVVHQIYDLQAVGNIDTYGYITLDSGVRELSILVRELYIVFVEWKWICRDVSSGRIGDNSGYKLRGQWLPETFLDLSEDSTYPESSCKGFLIKDVFERITAIYTGVENAVETDYFSSVSKMRNVAITNGLNIRSMRDKLGNLFPVVTSFKDFFDAASAIFNLGIRIENDKIRIEPKEYFFRREIKHTYLNVADISIKPSIEDIYNEFEVGYKKWETEKNNGIDEFNTQRTYALPIQSQRKRLSQLSSLIAAGYVIELTRRQQYSDTPTTDYRTDNDNFIIAVTDDGRIRSEKGTRTADNENIFSPEDAYNVRFSPKRNAERWSNVLAGCVVKKENPVAKFTTGKANFQAKLDGIREDSDIGLSVPFIFQPEIITFTFPISFSEFIELQNNASYMVAVGCGDQVEYEGFIQEVNYKPNNEGGIAEFQLIRG